MTNLARDRPQELVLRSSWLRDHPPGLHESAEIDAAQIVKHTGLWASRIRRRAEISFPTEIALSR